MLVFDQKMVNFLCILDGNKLVKELPPLRVTSLLSSSLTGRQCIHVCTYELVHVLMF